MQLRKMRSIMILRNAKYYPIYLIILLVLITLPRFNRNDIAIGSITSNGLDDLGDAGQYISIVQYFRGDLSANELEAPFTYRPFVPLVASVLPFDPMTSINIVNLFSMAIAVVYVFNLLNKFCFSEIWSFIGGVLFVVSFPVFYYATIGYIDATLICLLTIGFYLIIQDSDLVFLTLLCIGAFVKETVVILIPLWILYNILHKRFDILRVMFILLYIIAFYISYRMAKNVIPIGSKYFWNPNIGIFFSNMRRSRTLTSLILSMGLPGFLCLLVYQFRKSLFDIYGYPLTITMIAGFMMSILLYVYSLFSAYADGRFIWVGYIFSVPLSLIIIRSFYNRYIKHD